MTMIRTQTQEWTNEEWLAALQHPVSSEAVSNLHKILAHGLRIGLADRIPGNPEAFIDQCSHQAIDIILSSLKNFRHRSRFTTWAHKFAVYIALQELNQ
jgi:RNA polymerase sigma-70 factor (ECF subfamily)